MPRSVTYGGNVCCWLLALFCASPQASAAALLTPPPARTLTVVLDDNYPPYIFRDDQGVLQGILKDRWALWSARTGIPVSLQAMDWHLAQARMLQGQVDVIDTLFSTPERQQIYDFSPPYASIEVPIFFHKNISGIVGASSLKGFSVGVKAGDACIQNLQQHGITTFKPYPSYIALLQAAAQGEVVVFCIDKPPATFLLYKMGLEHDFRYSKPLYVGQFHWAVRRGNTVLKKSIEDGFKKISSTELSQIDEKWQGASLNSGKTLAMRQLLEILAGVLLLLTMLALWNLSLRRRVAKKTAEQDTTLRYLSATLAAIPDLLFEMDLQGVYYDYRAAHLDQLAAPPEQLLQHNVREVMPQEAAEIILSALQSAALTGTSHGQQVMLQLADGPHWFELSVARKQVDADCPQRFIILSRDITERKRAEAEIEKLAFFDPLTHLSNRRALHERLKQVLSAAQRQDHHAALLFIDIDHFKLLNDSRGHRVGDALLLRVAQQMQSCLREHDCLGRFGGDEFLVILDQLSRQKDQATTECEIVAEKLLMAIRLPCMLEGHEYHPTASIGITLFGPDDGAEEDEVLKQADMAMYRAKSGGRNAIRFFDPAMQAMQDSRAQLEHELRQAVAQQQFELHYQPQVDQQRGIVGAEALLRWRHPTRGLIKPAQFIAMAEENGLIVPIGHWAIEQACAILQRWGGSPATSKLFLAVNVSARQFQQPGFVHQVQCMLQQYQVKPGLLKFELTESLVLANVAESIDKMHLLQSMGIRLALDDFGTGYASLSYLKRLPLNEIKIDRTFMHNIHNDYSNAVIVRTIIAMAHNFGLIVVAEGIEQVEQRDFLFQNGCHQYQGFLISRPVTLTQFETLLTM